MFLPGESEMTPNPEQRSTGPVVALDRADLIKAKLGLDRLLIDENNPYHDKHKLINGRPRLGIFSEKIFREQVARGEFSFADILTMEADQNKCGSYTRGEVIKANVQYYGSMHHIYFIHGSLSEEQQINLDYTPSLRLNNGLQMYSANPYNSAIGLSKLFYDGSHVHRCKIEDLHCSYEKGALQLNTKLLLIDSGKYRYNVNYSCIFDYPQRISFYADIEPRARPARLCLGSPIPEDFSDEDVDKYFRWLMRQTRPGQSGEVAIKIIDFKVNTYHVDIIKDGQSIVASILDYFRDTKFRKFFSSELSNYERSSVILNDLGFMPVKQISQAGRTRSILSQTKKTHETQSFKSETEKYIGAVEYFRNFLEFAKHDRDSKKSYVQKRFPRVIVVDWINPDHLAIQPVGDYIKTHGQFIKRLCQLKCIKNAEKCYYKRDRPYFVGEHVLFRNTFGEPELGEWLRGVVIKRTSFNKHGLVLGTMSEPHSKLDASVEELLDSKMIDLGDVSYIVRSTDYGYQKPSSHINMRHVENQRELKSIGTWTIRCRLFGVNRQPNERRYSKSCIDVMHSWLRERLLDNGRLSHFHALIRSGMFGRMDSYDNQYEISLFHRFEPPCTFDESYLARPRKTRYDCLNWHLVERGLAKGSCLYNSERSSNIQLEEHVLNALVPHNMI